MHDQVFHDYLQLSRLLVNKLNEQLTENEFYHSQWLVLNYLKNYGASTLVDISDYLHVEKSAITRTVNRLEQNQLIMQIPSEDKRQRKMQLTEEGEEKFTLGRKTVEEIESQALHGISQEEQKHFFETLTKIKHNLNNGGSLVEKQ